MRFEDTPESTQTWIARLRPDPDAPTKLLCLHHAGGNPSNFRPWIPDVGGRFELFALRLAGRDARRLEAPATRMREIVEPLAEAVAPLFELGPLALFGHSLGALIGFELARELRRRELPRLRSLTVSGRRSPGGGGKTLRLHELPDHKFVKEVQRVYGGIPPAILAEPELLELTLPILRADLEVNETYEYRDEPALDTPIRAIGGTEDPHAIAEELAAWDRHTNAKFGWAQFEGEHFYLGSPAGRRWVFDQIDATR